VAFRGWQDEALEFFEGLEADNSKVYWEQHKSVYEQQVRAPMEELLAELEPDWGDGKIFRPYRDVRFSADKSPYKTNVAAVLGDGGYVHLSADGLGCGSGMYVMANDQLERFRAAVDDERSGREIERIVADAEHAGLEVTAHDTLKTAPKGYPKDHPRIDLLRRKGLITWKQWPPAAWLGTAKAKDRIVGFLEASKPLGTWLAKHVGPSTLPERTR
jgi:uncharacterized protein (TIGR02453 family)